MGIDLADLALEDAAGQVVMASLPGTAVDPATEHLLREGRAGAVCLFARNIASPAQARALCDALRTAAPRPLLIAADQEGGYVWRLQPPATHFPSAMAFGAAGRPDLTRAAACAAGTEMRAYGIDVALAPVADVNTNPRNPVIATRAYGGSPDLVATHVAAAVEGYRAAGVAACAKHFPGHGDTQRDSHLALPAIPHPLDRLRAVELPPFRAAIAAGVDLIMTAHAAFPSLAPDVPATIAPEIVQGLLRGELGFGGVVVSDAMDMRAIAERWGAVEGSVLAVIAGADLISCAGDAAQAAAVHAALLAAVRHGRLPAERLRQAAARVLALKARLAGLAPPARPTLAAWPPLESIGVPEHRRLAAEVAAASITAVGDTPALPLRPGERVGVVECYAGPGTGAEDPRALHGLLAREVAVRAPNAEGLLVDIGDVAASAAALDLAARADALVVATRNAWRSRAQLDLVRTLCARTRRAVVVALRDPYDLAHVPQAGARLAAYCDVPATVTAVVGVLFGAPAPGRLPVMLE